VVIARTPSRKNWNDCLLFYWRMGFLAHGHLGRLRNA
jgi:hypothetical protein